MLSVSCTIKSLLSGKQFFHTSVGCCDKLFDDAEQDYATSTENVGTRKKSDFGVHLRGMPYNATTDDVLEFLTPLVPVHIEMDPHNNGSCVVYMNSAEEAKDVLSRHLKYMGNRYIEVRHYNESNTFAPGGSMERGGDGDFVQGEKTAHQIHMRGLPFTCNCSDVADFFAPHNPTFIHLIKQANGWMSGCGVAHFSTEEEASNAMEKHLKYMGNRYIELRKQGFHSDQRFGGNNREEFFKMPVLQTTISPMGTYGNLNSKSFLGGLLRGSRTMIVENVRGFSTVTQTAKPSFGATILRKAVAVGRRSCKL